jgi:Flp pilus assembly protein TadD
MSTLSPASPSRPDLQRRRARRLSCRTAVSALALAFGLTACAGGAASPPAALKGDSKTAMLLKIADETNAGGDPATAASLYRQLHELSPKDPVPVERLAAIFMAMQDYRSAAEAYRVALSLDGGNPDLHRGLATALLVTGDSQGALVEIRTALEKRADDWRLYNLLGIAQDMSGRHDLAQQSYRHGSDLAPANVGLHNNYAMSLALSGDFGEAVAKLGEIAGPGASPRTRLNLALAYGLAGDDAKAAATARQVLDDASVQNNLAYYALLRGMDEKSRTAAIIGAELHGTAVTADAIVRSGAVAAAEPRPTAAPATPVASSPLPPLLPEAAAVPLAEAVSKPAVPPRHVAALADHPAPVPPVEKAAKAAPSSAAVLPAAAPRDMALPADHPAPPQEAAIAPPPPTPAAPAPDGAAAAHALPQQASQPPISLVAPQKSPSPEPAVLPAAEDQAAPAPPVDGAAKTGAVLPEPAPLPQPAAPAKPEASLAGPSADAALEASIVAPAAADPSAADSDFVARVNAWLDMRAIALALAPEPALAPKPEAAIAQPAPTLHSATESYTVQLGSFLYEASAHRIADAFAAKGVIVSLSRSNDHDGREWYVARSGEFASLDDATGVLHMIQSMGGAEPILVRHRLPGEASPAI